jgi:hypothetical protein
MSGVQSRGRRQRRAAALGLAWSYDPQTVRVYEALSGLYLKAVPLIMSLWSRGGRARRTVRR